MSNGATTIYIVLSLCGLLQTVSGHNVQSKMSKNKNIYAKE